MTQTQENNEHEFFRRTSANRPQKFLKIALAGVFLAVSGCGDSRPPRVPLSGRVLIDGKPLAAGIVIAYPAGHREAAGKIGADGRFTLMTFGNDDGCVLGKHPCAVLGKKDLDVTTTQWLAPKKYANPQTSGLHIEVTGPRDDLEIKLTWTGSESTGPYKEVERSATKTNLAPQDQ